MIRQFKNQLNKIERLLISVKQNETEFMDIDEASHFLKLKKSTVYQLVFRKEIPYYKSTKKLLFKKNELVDWVESNKVRASYEILNHIGSDAQIDTEGVK